MMRPRLLIFCGLVVLAGCGSDRDRPSPVGPNTPLELFSEVQSPPANESVEAGRELTIRIRAAETFRRLEGVGYVIHRFGAPLVLDSVALHFALTDDTIHTFSFRVPPALPTNAQLDVRGIAYGPNGETSRSFGRSIIVIACQPTANWCR